MREFAVIVINALYMGMCGYVLYSHSSENAVIMALASAGIIAIISIVGVMLPSMSFLPEVKSDEHTQSKF